MIVSFVEGRVRVRHPALKDAETMATIESMLADYPGVLQAVPNPVTGSLLVHYDPEQISTDDLKAAAAMLEAQLGPATSAAGVPGSSPGFSIPESFFNWLPRKCETNLLNAGFSLCLLGLVASKKLHTVAGGAFAALTLFHALRRR